MIGRREEHLVLVGQDHGLQHIDHLGDRRQLHPVGMALEDVEGQRRHFRIAQRVLLIEKAGMAARLLVVPGAPFIHIQSDLLVGVIFVHHRAEPG